MNADNLNRWLTLDAKNKSSWGRHSMMKRIMLGLFLVYSLSAYGQGEILPLELGNSWTYQIDGDAQNTVTESTLPEFEINDNGLIRIDTVPVENDSTTLPVTVFYHQRPFFGDWGIARETIDGDVFTYVSGFPLPIYIGGASAGLFSGDVTYQPGGMGSVFP